MIPQLTQLACLFACALPGWLLLRGGWFLLCRRPLRPWREAAMAVFAAFMAGVMLMALNGQ